jgi:hypothetical protein
VSKLCETHTDFVNQLLVHGILGTLEFIKDTPLDSFQTSMLNSLNACSQTLLDTINHVMDYARIKEITRNVSSRRLKSSNTIRLSAKPLISRRSKVGAFDLGIATEEVVEAVFAGSSYTPVSSSVMMDSSSSPSDAGSDNSVKRKVCYCESRTVVAYETLTSLTLTPRFPGRFFPQNRDEHFWERDQGTSLLPFSPSSLTSRSTQKQDTYAYLCGSAMDREP